MRRPVAHGPELLELGGRRVDRDHADFAKLVELFDQHKVTFVSVTQSFSTTTSMGRLTLNILLSFAQFERELSGERVRDKIAASRQRGIWMGGMPPLGYDVAERKLVINAEEAKIVRESALNVWQQSCQQLYLPRLKDDTVFQLTMGAGAESRDFYGFSQGKEEGRYVGFSYGKRTSLIMDSSLMLIEPFAAAAYMEALRAAEEASRAKAADTGGGASTTTVTTGGGGGTPRVEDSGKGGYPSGTGGAGQALKKQFYGSIELDPILAKKQFADLVDEVVQQFTMRTGVKVKIAIEIQAESATGFDDGLQRAVKENCNVLKFKNAEFETGD